MQQSRTRPAGITILVILEVIVSFFLLLGGLALALLEPIIRGYMPMPMMFVGAFIFFFGIVFVVLGLLGLIVSWGLWTGQGWAWAIAFALAIIGAIMGLFSLPPGVVALLIDGFIAYYLWQPRVRAFYGGITPRTAIPPQQPSPEKIVYCSTCGTPNSMDAKFCKKCGAELNS